MLRLGRHTLYEKYEDIPDYVAADFVSTDPPWNKTKIGFDTSGFDHLRLTEWISDNMKPNAWVQLFGPMQLASIFDGVLSHKFEMVWVKPSGPPTTKAVKRPIMNHELVWFFVGRDLKRMSDLYMDKETIRTPGEPYTDTSTRHAGSEYQEGTGGAKILHRNHVNTGYREGKSVVFYPNKGRMPRGEATEHPTQKPLELLRLLIRGYCPPGGIVLDPTLGSGTTLIAAELEGRTCIGAETNPKYQKMIRDRFNETSGGRQA